MAKNLVNVASPLRTSSSVMCQSYSLMYASSHVDSLLLANLTCTVQYEQDDVTDFMKNMLHVCTEFF